MATIAKYRLVIKDKNIIELRTNWFLKIWFLILGIVASNIYIIIKLQNDIFIFILILFVVNFLFISYVFYRSYWIINKIDSKIEYSKEWFFKKIRQQVYFKNDIKSIEVQKLEDIHRDYKISYDLNIILETGEKIFVDSTRYLNHQEKIAKMISEFLKVEVKKNY